MMLPRCALLVLLAGALAVLASAQTGNEGSIEGTITDPSGAVITGAQVSARNIHTSATLTTASDERGEFRFLVVPVGVYEIQVSHPDFADFVRQGVGVAVGAKVSYPISLRVGTRAESVVVASDVPLVETTRTSFSTTVDQRSLTSLPINGRNFLNLVLLTPGATSGTSTGAAFGGRDSMSSLLVDGADQNGFGPGTVGNPTPNRYLFSQEAVQEFQVNTNSYSAEFGRAGTGVINVVTKSGTNQLHGTLFWYYRDRGLNAAGYINKLNHEPKDPFHAHQFGGAVGGPLIKDRLFFYASYDGQRRGEQNLTVLNLPPGFAFDPDQLVAGFQQLALHYLEARADPFPLTFNQNVLLGKVDWQMSPAHRLSGRWARTRLTNQNVVNTGPDQSLEHTGPDRQIADTLSVSLTSVLSSSRVNVVRFGYLSNQQPQDANNHNPEAAVFEGGQQVLQVGHSSRVPVNNRVQRFESSDTLSLHEGSHALKFGVLVLVDRGRFKSGANFFGSYRFNSLQSFGRSLAQLPLCPALPQCRAPLAGERYTQAFSGLGTPPIDVHVNFVHVAGFAQDEWRLRPSLTLSLGLRYEVQIMAESSVRNPSPALAAAGVDTSFIPTDSNNFAPRFGFAWDPLSTHRLVIRGGYGLYFPRLPGNTTARAFFQNGITVQTRRFTGATIPAYPNTICGPPDPSGAPPDCPAPVAGADIIQAFSRHYQASAVQQGSFGVEYELLKDVAVSVIYLRVKGDHLLHWQDINLSPPDETATIGIAGTGTVLSFRQYPNNRPIMGFDRVLLLKTNGNSSYHALALQANKRFSHNFQFLGSYTFSKVVDDNPTLGLGSVGPPGGDITFLSDSLAPSLDRSVGGFDERHRFVLSGVWELRYADKLSKPARTILSGWEISGILIAHSGGPYSGMVNFDLNNDGNAATDRTPGLARNTYRLPATVSFDPRVTRKFSLTERVRLQVSWDAFNAFNRVNISGVNTTHSTGSTSPGTCFPAAAPCLVPQSSFGSPTTALDPRIMQISAKLSF